MSSNDSGEDRQSAVAEALARAREVAAKLNKGAGESGGIKRSSMEADGPSDVKRMGLSSEEGLTTTELATRRMPRAAEVARQINAQLGITQKSGASTGSSLLQTEHLRIPDSFVGLVIGKGGEKIAKIQTDSACKVQIAQDLLKSENGDGMERLCTLTGNREAIGRARVIIKEILEGGMRRRTAKLDELRKDGVYGEYGNNNKQPSHLQQQRADLIEVTRNVPTDRAGYVIGKGGETIKDINRRSGAHVETDRATKAGEPGEFRLFRIKGTKEQVELALEMIEEKVQPPSRSYGGGRSNYYDRRDEWSYRNRYNAPVNNIPTWQQIPSDILYQNSGMNWANQWQTFMMAGMSSANPQPTMSSSQQLSESSVSAQSNTPDAFTNDNCQTGEVKDYSLQWIQYYRSMGMHEQADAIVRQLGQQSTNPANTDSDGAQNATLSGPENTDQQTNSANSPQ